MSQTTTKLGLKIWDQNSDQFSHVDLQTNWTNLENRVKWMQAGQASIASGSYIDGGAVPNSAGNAHWYYKDITVTFGNAFPSPAYAWAVADVAGVTVVVPSAPSTTQAIFRAVQIRNDASGPAVALTWFAILP